MNIRGHLRYAFIAVADAKGHIAAALDLDVAGGRSAPGMGAAGRALVMVSNAGEVLGQLLDAFGLQQRGAKPDDNDNGETPLEWAREALQALRRYDHCYKGLGKAWDLPESAATDSSEEIKILEMIVAKLEKGAAG